MPDTTSSGTRRQCAAQIGIVFQDSTLDERLTARENLVFHGELYGLARAEINQRSAAMIERVGLADRAGDVVLTFSGGMKRRLEIARGLMHSPSVLFLDEPTIGLDPQTRRSLWSYAQSLRDAEGVTIFMTTHYMDEAEACDRIAIIDNGQIVALDTPAGLKSGLGGDVVSVSGRDNQALAKEISERFEVDPSIEGEAVEFRVDNGESFLPLLFARLATPLETVLVRRPTLDDVFVALTGHQIRESAADETDKMRNLMKSGRGGFGPGGGGRPGAGGRR